LHRLNSKQNLFIIHKYNNTYYRQNTTLGKDVVYSYMFRLIKSSSGWKLEPYNITWGLRATPM
jgi:hypothetical protein